MTIEDTLSKLREPFPAEQIGKLPRLSCTDCSNNKTQKHCDKHKMIRCDVCGNWISERHVHLDYVGHAEVTDRLLKADPLWTWAPMGTDESGLPALDRNGGLWIKLTIAGITRPGYGDAQGKNGPNAVKEAIGDAIRNAAMRFGVGLDLWAKSDLDAGETTSPAPEPVAQTVSLAGYIKEQLTPVEIELLREHWRADGYGFQTTAVPVHREAELRTLVDSFIGLDETGAAS